ncbi:MAG TPA: SUMF1/EgtB/PvdO family nonheme iron enzyme, partial [Gemmataceae bacterium]|nr:SUMF1/EgtB/PvdO family nonheme iron enzyme [Gemmataceae bacterium]
KLQAGPRHLTGTRALIDVAAAIGGTGNWSGLVAEQARRRNRPDVFEQVELICEDATREPLVTEAAPRVLRGGSFLYPAGDLRCANRNWVRPSYRNYNVGFRVARTLVFPTG